MRPLPNYSGRLLQCLLLGDSVVSVEACGPRVRKFDASPVLQLPNEV